jgi:tetratricopeptide (TPR) repeat protein
MPLSNAVGLLNVIGAIQKLIAEAAIDDRVIQTLAPDGVFIPVEKAHWDYKREVETTALGLAGIVKDIAAFHNSFGGYIVVGVAEDDSPKAFKVVGTAPAKLGREELRDQIARYVTPSIDATIVDLALTRGLARWHLGLIHIPKRSHRDVPATFLRNGPEVSPGKPLFRQGGIPLRAQDESRIQSSRDDLVFLMGPRTLSAFESDEGGDRKSRATFSATPLENNLPDKNSICPSFVGREELLDDLWLWLADPFAFVKVLAGDGGKGKTSIAYEFAREVAATRYGAFEQVVWLSAKRAQFRPLINQYQPLQQQDYADLATLLKAICVASGISESELEGLDANGLKRSAKRSLELIPSLIVVDDVDSAPPNEQRRILEAAQQIGNSTARLLITTRANVTYSSDVCLVVPGLNRNDFREFVGSLGERLNLPPITGKDSDALQAATDGSPLLAESMLRLVRQGMPLRQAIQEWRGHAGADARSASLQKEIDSLTSDAKRVMLVVALLQECSLAEIKTVTGYQGVRLTDAIALLQGLFLVAAPAVTADEPRLAIGAVTRGLVLEQASKLVPDHRRLEQNAKELRSETPGATAKPWMVGAAIKQAAAQLVAGKVQEAEGTLRQALRSEHHHKDLLAMLGRVLMQSRPHTEEARHCFEEAHRQGARRLDFLRDWHRMEVAAENYAAAEAICDIGVQFHGNDSEWWQSRAYARARLARLSLSNRDPERALRIFEESADDLARAIKNERGALKNQLVLEAARLHDVLLELAETMVSDPVGTTFDILWRAEQRGDHRRKLYGKMVEIVEMLVGSQSTVYVDSSIDRRIAVFLQRALEATRNRPTRSVEQSTVRDTLLDRLNLIEETYLRRRKG